MDRTWITIEGNEAVATIAHALSEVIAIYPITPSTLMGEFADAWSAAGRVNLWGTVPLVVEMQSEGGAAGAIHGALQTGALATTFTASQGLLLMIPNMYKIAGELTPTVFHVAARSLAAQGLSIFGDHSDVMATRATGFALLASNSVQEAQDMALIAHASTLSARVPFLHFFDGFRTSHEINKIEQLTHEDLRAMIDDSFVQAHRQRALSPEHPFIRGTAQNPDVYFQARESVNAFYQACPAIVQETMDKFATIIGRQYHLFDYVGAPDAERVIVAMGSGAETAQATAEYLVAQGEKVGVVKVRLFRPFSVQHFLQALPPSVNAIAVLDRTKEPGSVGEPLYLDIVTAINEGQAHAAARDGKGGGGASVGTRRSRSGQGEGVVGSGEPLPSEDGAQARTWAGASVNPTCIIGGRYGLASKEFTPAMVKGIFDELCKDDPKHHFTIGINDDVTYTSLAYDPSFSIESPDTVQCVYWGLGSDGTVGANKNSIKIIGEETDNFAQGYFVYDSKKSGSVTISHLRFGPHGIHAPYLIGDDQANFVACHQFSFLERFDVLTYAKPGGVFLLASIYRPDEVWDHLPRELQQTIIDKKLRFYVIDAFKVASDIGMGGRINTVMQTCFFAISGILPQEQAIEQIKKSIRKTYGKRGEPVVQKNFQAVDSTLEHLYQVQIPDFVGAVASPTINRGPMERSSEEGRGGSSEDGEGGLLRSPESIAASRSSATNGHSTNGRGIPLPMLTRRPPVPAEAPEFVQRVLGPMIEGRGDSLPVSVLPCDGTYPSGTTQWEKRNIALEMPVWDPDICIQCGKCVMVCPHAVIREKVFDPTKVGEAPESFLSTDARFKEFPGLKYTLQVSPEDCTGCALCFESCPVKDKRQVGRKAINMAAQPPIREREKANWEYFLTLPDVDGTNLNLGAIKNSQLITPLFEFSLACSGCGETPYIKLATQLFGDRMIVANATGCSSIYGGNHPTTPWTFNREGRGPAWSNSLFEDNAEFGLGMRLTLDKQQEFASELLEQYTDIVGEDLVQGILAADQSNEAAIKAQRARVALLKQRLQGVVGRSDGRVQSLLGVADALVRKSVWIVGGDGWAYDIGFGGLDHVMASGRNVNILVLDTEVYSNTGGQASKSTPRGAVAKFAAKGKATAKKDLGMLAMAYGNVYVARVAMGANDQQTLHAFLEAEAYDGPSLIIAYSHCIAHGIDMRKGLEQQKLAVQSGYWPLYRFNPMLAEEGKNPLIIDSKAPSIPLEQFAYNETRFRMLVQSDEKRAEELMQLAKHDVKERWQEYQELAEEQHYSNAEGGKL